MFKHSLNMLISTGNEWSVQIVYDLYIYYRYSRQQQQQQQEKHGSIKN